MWAGSGNGVGIGGRGRGGRLGGEQSRQGPCSRGRDPSASGRREGQVRGGGPCTPGVGGRVRQSPARSRSTHRHSGQQRGHHGSAGTQGEGGRVRAAARNKLSVPLRADGQIDSAADGGKSARCETSQNCATLG